MRWSEKNFPSNYEFIKESLDEILDKEILNETTEKMSPVSEYCLQEFKKAFSALYGNLVSEGILIRAGRAGFYYWMRDHSENLGWKESDFRLLPMRKKSKRAMTDLINWLTENRSLAAEIQENTDTWIVNVTGLISDHSILECSYFTGLIQELFIWAGGGKFIEVHETLCQSEGGAYCQFEITKTSPD